VVRYPRPTEEEILTRAKEIIAERGLDPSVGILWFSAMESARLQLDPYFSDQEDYDEEGNILPRPDALESFNLDPDGHIKGTPRDE